MVYDFFKNIRQTLLKEHLIAVAKSARYMELEYNTRIGKMCWSARQLFHPKMPQ